MRSFLLIIFFSMFTFFSGLAQTGKTLHLGELKANLVYGLSDWQDANVLTYGSTGNWHHKTLNRGDWTV